ncbi:hypothetical protein GCM10022243_26560 [Saccharothrix violaceirubra]|uniref:NTP pyrophosphohydrolase n=1 Tax=Saccharothrix violaceirubra TaxID=413306 RepID=A0A7W7WZK6_9PSEU|nr:NTP pyrophosphohydrolase [Saccharothrix violaceirubra]MBB4969422.1 hypothetical protein [Saccharothrix violaceirubra]
MGSAIVVVDAANVVGSVPDGWWKDRWGATERLRDSLIPLVANGLPGFASGPLEVVLVVEGRVRDLPSVPGVRVVGAPGSGDDTIVSVVRDLRGRRCAVVTADRELRRRVTGLGAEVLGPHSVRG